MIKGSCLCAKVTYQISGAVGDIIHCHCETCRKAHGAAFSSVASVDDQDFQVFGRDQLSVFESSPGKHRYFCKNCGTQVYAKREHTDHVILRLGSLDSEPNSREVGHIWLEDKASWYQLSADLPQHQKGG